MVPKCDGTFRLCTDFRKINAVTVPGPFSLPRVEDLNLDRVGKSKYPTKLDMTRGYCQVPLESIPVSAFVTPCGHFQWRSCLLDCETHLQLANLTSSSVNLLRWILTISGLGRVQPRQKKAEALLAYLMLTDRKQLQSFLGLAGYHPKFVPNYGHISAVISDLLKQGTKFVWTPAAEQACPGLKSRLSTQPVLRPPNNDRPFCLTVDGSDLVIGAMLFQVTDGRAPDILL